MKIREMEEGRGLIVVLSKRNLLALLHKVDLPEGESHRTLARDTEEGVIIVTAEPDDQHYGDRIPGPVTPDTDAFIRGYEGVQTALEVAAEEAVNPSPPGYM